MKKQKRQALLWMLAVLMRLLRGQHVTEGLSRYAQSEEDHFGFSDVSTSVDATLAVNSVNTSNS